MTYSTIKRFFLSAAVVISALTASAIPARPGAWAATQSDGSTVMVKLVGDEWSHFYMTEDGYLLVHDGNDFCYATLENGKVRSLGIKAADPARRSATDRSLLQKIDRTAMNTELATVSAARREAKLNAAGRRFINASGNIVKRGPGLFPDTRFPHKGKQKSLVILVEYQDVKMQSGAYDYFTNLLNQEGFSDNGGTGSAGQYFRENSMGQFDPDFDVYGPVTLKNNRSYYGGNDSNGDDLRPHEMVIEACAQLASQINFADYDRDNDGYVDNVYIFYAGHGENEGGGTNCVWPHSWSVAGALGTTSTRSLPRYNNKYINSYGCSNELLYLNSSKTREKRDGIGTFVHEFGHILGLPDLYATSYTGGFLPDDWTVMCSGSYNNNSNTPPYYTAFERYALDWVTPRVIDGPDDITLNPISTNDVCLIKGSDNNNFFLFENRQQTGWDTYIPGHGMLEWRIKYDENIWSRNIVNNSPGYHYVDIIEADGTQTESSRAGDAFPGTSRVTSINSHAQIDGYTVTNLPFTEIAETNGIITFKVAGGIVKIDPVEGLYSADVTPYSFTANWNATANATGYRINLRKVNDDGTETPVSGWENCNLGNILSSKIQGLDPETTYRWNIVAYNSSVDAAPSADAVVTTAKVTLDYITPEIVTATANYFWLEFTWNPIPDATHYLVDVYTKEMNSYNENGSTLDNLQVMRNDGWNGNVEYTYAAPTYVNSEGGAVRFTAHDQYITSPEVTDDIHEFSFWHKGCQNLPTEAYLVVEAKNPMTAARAARAEGETWTEVSRHPVTTAGTTTTVSSFPAGTRQVRLRLDVTKPSENTSALGISVDDPVIRWGVAEGKVYVPGHQQVRHEASEPTLHRAEYLEPGKTYYYTVTASDGKLYSHTSAEGSITTWNSPTGIEGVSAINSLAVSGLNVTITANGIHGVTVTNMLGTVIATRTVDNVATFTLPAHGIYFFAIDGKVLKVRV